MTKNVHQEFVLKNSENKYFTHCFCENNKWSVDIQNAVLYQTFDMAKFIIEYYRLKNVRIFRVDVTTETQIVGVEEKDEWPIPFIKELDKAEQNIVTKEHDESREVKE